MNNVVRVEDSKYLTGQGGSGGSGGHIIQNDSGTALAQESALQFVGVYSEDDSTNGKTKVNIIREMTKAQMDALSTEAKKGLIRTTDEPDNPANPISAEDVTYGSGTVKDALDGKAEIGIYTINSQRLNAGLNVITIPNSNITLSDTCISVYTNYAQSDVRLLSWTFVKTSSEWVVCINNSGSMISSVTVVVVYVKA